MHSFKGIFRIRISLLLILVIICFSNKGFSQLTGKTSENILTTEKRDEVIDTIARLLSRNYIFPEMATSMSVLLRDNQKAGKYEQATSPLLFARMVMQDLRALSKDNHIIVSYRPVVNNQTNSISAQIDTTYGIRKTEILPGNIGYLKFDYFPPGSDEEAKKKFGSVFTTFKSVDAIIIDLLDNYGGNTQMEAYLCSYFFQSTPTHLWDGYYRPGDTTYNFYTQADIDGIRHPDIPVYILTSSGTFSAGEAFAYDLQAQKRGSIVGETTAGGAHPTALFDIGNGFMIRVPVTKITNAVTKSDWEGVGVKPDVSCIRFEAFDMAYVYGLKEVAAKTTARSKKKILEELISKKAQEEQKFIKANERLVEYAGSYGIRKIIYSKGKIYFQREQEPLVPMRESKRDLFIWGDNKTQLQFNRDNTAKVTGFDIIRPNETIPVKKD